MLGAINPSSDTNLTKQVELAKSSRYMLDFDETMAPAESASLAALASTVLAEPKENDETLSTGAIAGIAVGGAVLLALLGALLFCLRRNRKLKKQSALSSQLPKSTRPPEMRDEHRTSLPPGDARTMPSAKTSPPLPPYAQFAVMEPPKSPEPSVHTRAPSTVPASHASYIPYKPGHDERSTRYDRHVIVDVHAPR